MKKILILIFSMIFLKGYAIPDIETAQSVGTYLANWAETNDMEYLKKLHIVLNYPQGIICDNTAIILAKKNNAGINKNYRIGNYLGWLQNEIKFGAKIKVINYRLIPASETDALNTKGCGLVKCTFIIEGDTSINSDNLLYIKDEKVLKIDNYVETTTPSGKKKVHVDFSGINLNYSAWEVSYNYSKHFPFGISVNYCPAESPIIVGLDFGWSAETNPIINETMDYQDVGNFKRTREELKPKFYITFTPSYVYKYFSIGIGLGSMFYTGTEYVEHYQYSASYDTSIDGSLVITGSNRSKYDNSTPITKKNFMIRPVIKGYLPIHDGKIFLSAGVGYDYIFKYTKQNGINFSLGLHVSID